MRYEIRKSGKLTKTDVITAFEASGKDEAIAIAQGYKPEVEVYATLFRLADEEHGAEKAVWTNYVFNSSGYLLNTQVQWAEPEPYPVRFVPSDVRSTQLLVEKKIGRGVVRVYDDTIFTAYVFAESPASRCGDEEPFRGIVAKDDLRRMKLL